MVTDAKTENKIIYYNMKNNAYMHASTYALKTYIYFFILNKTKMIDTFIIISCVFVF